MSYKTIKQIYLEHSGKISDKWALYLDEWERLFSPYQDRAIRILEIGIQNGGSLEVWGKYFLKAEKIIGCDIDPKCENLEFDDSRISVIVDDANTDDCERKITELSPIFNIIIDDGSHKSSDIVRSFGRYFPTLSEEGLYVVEDLHASYWQSFEGGLYQPLSAMAFFKRLADIVNYEHWRNNKSRSSLLSRFSEEYGVQFDEFDLPKIHSIEFINSLCIIRKSSPDKNILGIRNIVGDEELVTTFVKKLSNTTILDMALAVEDDTKFDVFDLIQKTETLTERLSEQEDSILNLTRQLDEIRQYVRELLAHITEKDQVIQSLIAQVAEKEQAIQSFATQVTEMDQIIQSLMGQVAEKDQVIQSLMRQVVEKDLATQSFSAQVAEKDQAIQSLMAQVAEKDQVIQSLTSQMADKDLEAQSLVAQINQIQNESRYTEKMYTLSTSWRITKPLRAIAGFLRRGGK